MKNFKFIIALVTLMVAGIVPVAGAAPKKFFLKDGDRVCFYGDSITEQRFYPAEVQTYVLTRFPNLQVRYVDAGVGGDTVRGGWAGSIDVRLKRDVFPFKPNVVTIMLGMNDAGYKPFNQPLFDVYKKGYEHIIASLKKHLPGVRIVLLGPSPFDDVTHKPRFSGGYNAVLVRYDDFVKQLAAKNHLLYVDFNAPMVKVLTEAQKINPQLAQQIIPGRIHPSAAGEMMMAQTLLKAWGAPATVTRVSINAADGKITDAVNTKITDMKSANGTLSWTELDGCLPMPVLALHENWPQFPPFWHLFLPPQPKPAYTNPVSALIDKLSGFTHQLDREMLTVKGLSAKRYTLLIDGKAIGKFSAQQLAQGVNLSHYFTPMLWQSYDVSNLVWEQIQTHFVAWHTVQTTFQNYLWGKKLPVSTENDPAVARNVRRAVKYLNRIQHAIVKREYQANQPKPHQFELIPASQ